MKKEEYKNILQNNGYINLINVIDFLRQNCIADYEVISIIFNSGMSTLDYQELQAALNEIENEIEEVI